MPEYELENASFFGEVPRSLGNLQHFLERDIGVAVPFEVMDNLGMGEVVDADPPPEPVHSPIVNQVLDHSTILDLFHAFIAQADKKIVKHLNPANVSLSNFQIPGIENVTSRINLQKPSLNSLEVSGQGNSFDASSGTISLKGKGKLYEKASFNNNGIMSSAVMEMLKSGALNHISDVFAQQIVNLDAHVLKSLVHIDTMSTPRLKHQLLNTTVEQ